jgi:alpha-L-rhamnosidase
VTLTAEYLRDPVGLQEAMPLLSWRLSDPRRGGRQTACQIEAATSHKALLDGQANRWNSGRVKTEQSTLIAYEGSRPGSGERVWWRVRYWDQNGAPSPWSAPAFWETGLLDPSDWKGKWIGLRPNPPLRTEMSRRWARHALLKRPSDAKALEFFEENWRPAQYLRRTFQLNEAPRRARLYVSGLGYSVVHINGKHVGDRVLDPAESHYPEQAYYATHDVTDLLRAGENVIAVALGTGWYGASGWTLRSFDPADLRSISYGDGLGGLLLQLNVLLPGDRLVEVHSDMRWKASTGPLLRSLLFTGECYDARREMKGWTEPGFDDSQWGPATELPPLAPRVTAQQIPPERRLRTLRPKRVYSPARGVWVFDFGEHFSGWTRLKVSAPRGTTIIQRYAESVRDAPAGQYYDDGILPPDDPAGMIHFVEANSNSQRLAEGAASNSCNLYVAGGEGLEVWEPQFSYSSVRYVEMIGFPGKPSLDTIEGIVAHTDLRRAGRVETSDPNSNAVLAALARTVEFCWHSKLQDNVNAERGGFLPMYQANGDFLRFHWDAYQVGRKLLEDIRLQTVEGYPPTQAPTRFRGLRSQLPGEDAVTVEAAWQQYVYYGDRQELERHYAYMAHFIENWRDVAENRITDFPGHGDWSDAHGGDGPRPPSPYIAPERQRPPAGPGPPYPLNTPINLSVALHFCNGVQLLARIAGVLGRPDDAGKYASLAARVRENINRQWYNTVSHTYGSQASNAMALEFGVVPNGDVALVANSLAQDFSEKWGGHLSSGWHSTFVPTVLSRYGHEDAAHAVFRTDTYPSFGQFLKLGRNTIPARWPENRNSEPYFFRFVQSEKCGAGKWFYDSLGGIQPDPEHPAFGHFFLRPVIPPRLTRSSVEYESVRGLIRSEWKRMGGQIEWKVTVPPNTSARMRVPASSAGGVTESGKPLPEALGIREIGGVEGAVEFEASAGSYVFLFEPAGR